jgi:hypothetical protein
MHYNAPGCWSLLNGIKEPLVRRCERYATLTIPKVCLPEGFNMLAVDQTHDYQSIGAQATNHLTNKIMMALFRPSQPFFRMNAGDATKAQLQKIGLDETALSKALGELERQAVRLLDNRAQRPKLYTAIRHLIITGNVLLHYGKETIRTMSIKYYCVKRNADGSVHTLIIKERVKYDELDPKVKDATQGLYHDMTEVDHYRWLVANDKGGQWINATPLPPDFNAKYTAATMPYRVLTWDLADEADYGTGLVEEYAGDLEALSVLSESVVDGAVLGAEMRWLVNPTGMTTADDLNDSKNGDALPGRPEDIDAIQGGNHQAIQVADAVMSKYEKRVSMAFLMQTGVTRDAERVTAEEIRQTTAELETSYGGVYSTLGTTLQKPTAEWLLRGVDSDILRADFTITVVTGLDALSRGGDLENLRLALQDLAGISALPPELQGRIKFNTIADYVGNGRGIDLSPFLKTEEEYQQYLDQMAQARAQEANAIAAGEAGAKAGAAQATQGAPTQ